MKESHPESKPSHRMIFAIHQGVKDGVFSYDHESYIVNEMGDILTDHGDNFPLCNNMLRQLFFDQSRILYNDILLTASTKKHDIQLETLWASVIRLIFEGQVPYHKLLQVCQNIEILILQLEPDTELIVRQESLVRLLLIWLEHNDLNSFEPFQLKQ